MGHAIRLGMFTSALARSVVIDITIGRFWHESFEGEVLLPLDRATSGPSTIELTIVILVLMLHYEKCHESLRRYSMIV